MNKKDTLYVEAMERQNKIKKKYFEDLKAGDRVIYFGWSSYSYYEGHDISGGIRFKVRGTIKAINANNIVIELDDSKKPYFAEGTCVGDNYWVIPSKDIATVTLADLITGDKKIEVI